MTSNHHLVSATALTLAGVCACASFGSSSNGAPQRLVLAGARSAGAGLEVPTASLALDRVTKRRPELSGMARRVGTGRGVAIYVFDGGVATDHPELIGRVRIGFDAFPSNPRLCNAHGTAVAGAAAGATLGVAPGAEIVDVKIINCAKNVGSIDAIVAAARWTAEDHRRHPGQPAVVNWSFVVDTSRVVPGIDTAVAILRDAGLLVVGSAGNLNIDACRVSPPNSGGILVVGASALTQDTTTAGQVGRSAWRDVRARNTAWGRCIDVYAPGESVLLPNLEGDKPTTSLWDGTSMATGYVSGAASLVLERIPTAAPGDVARIIAEAATEIAVDERINVVGPARARHSRLLYVGPR